MNLIVYHGATEVIESPLVTIGRENLDFGKGFYLTDIREQAARWALSVAAKRRLDAVINVYELGREALMAEARCKIFSAYDEEWLNFIVANRRGDTLFEEFDYVEGGVADDRVIDTVNLYIAGLMSVDVALTRLSLYQPSNQICILNQRLIDKYLHYYGTESAK